MKCYQIDFADDSRMLVDSNSEADARDFAVAEAYAAGLTQDDPGTIIASCSCLSDDAKSGGGIDDE